MYSKDADRMANSVDPNDIAPQEQSDGLYILRVCGYVMRLAAYDFSVFEYA